MRNLCNVVLLFKFHAIQNIDSNSYKVCPENTVGCYGFGCPNTCFCEEHCSWAKCRLEEPPKDCIETLGGVWVKNSVENYWTAKFTGIKLYDRYFLLSKQIS